MPTKIRRCLYIGLGGTGMNSILNTKKMFVDTYGEVPPMVAFLGIDTDGNAYNRMLLSNSGEPITLEPFEQLSIQVEEPQPIYEHHTDQLNWFPQENLYALTHMTVGAGMIRSNGRFALWLHANEVVNKINVCLSNITNAQIIDNRDFGVLANQPEIHIAFSVCGGTGCGTFINLAYLIQEHCSGQRCKVIGYGVLADVFEIMNPTQMPNVKANAYGAIKDLDFLMHLNMGSEQVRVENRNDVYSTNTPPFNAFFFIDNKNSNGDTYTHIDEICEMLGLSLVTAAGELSNAAASTTDNVEKVIAAGDMDIKNKRAWAAGIGISEIIFKNEKLTDVYCRIASKILISKLLQSDNDMTTVANAWIDHPTVNIRENNGQDNVIDEIFSKNPRFVIADIDDKRRPDTEVRTWLTQVTDDDDEVKNYQQKVAQMLDRVKGKLAELVYERTNRNGGVKETIDLLECINQQIDLFLGEMNDERTNFLQRQKPLEASLQATINDLANYNAPFWGKNRTDEKVEEVKATVTNLAINMRETTRRTAAISFYNGLKFEIDNYLTKLNDLKQRLNNLLNDLSNEVSQMQNTLGLSSKEFQIDLTPRYAQRIDVNKEAIVVADFIQGINVNGQRSDILNLLNCDKEVIKQIFLNFIGNTREAQQWKNLTIDNVIDEMSEDELKVIVRRALTKSLPLLPFNYQSVGLYPEKQAEHYFYIGVANKDASRLNRSDIIKNMASSTTNPEFCSIGVKDSIIFYRQVGVLPPFVISSLNTYEGKYSSRMERVNCHYDKNVEQRMAREKFSLWPEEREDNSLEIWIKGLVLGVVRNVDGKYQYLDEENGDPLDDYWVSLPSDNNDRAQAYASFKQLGSNVLDHLISNMEKSRFAMGDEKYKELIEDVKKNYWMKFSQINMTKDMLNAKGYENVKALFRDELNYVNKQL